MKLQMHAINAEEKELIELLLEMTPKTDAGVDSLVFRAQHYEKIEVLDRLEQEGYIRKELDNYFVSLTALVQLDSKRAMDLLSHSEPIFRELKAHYRKTPRDPMQVDALSDCSGVDPVDTRIALSYMVEGPWWGGRSNSFFATPDSYIAPAESILKFESFANVIQQLRGWQTARIRDRQKAMATALRAFSPSFKEPPQLIVEPHRQKPDWFDQLPESPRDLLVEIYAALSLDLRALPAMGLRAVIDVVCMKQTGDAGSFEKKLSTLKQKGLISEVESSILSDAIDAGSASAHRGYVPGRDDLESLLDIVEHLLRAQYILPEAAKKLKLNTPQRGGKTAKET
ncbi:MAG: DUF4145 domain-containing protein [Gammaproteobacteria bacterium]|nr:DUF4145 domain-containing protein [Gammaproteobacteria bacterium]